MKGITAVMSNKALVVIDMELRLTNVPYEQMHDFALDRSFDLDAEQYDRFMLRAHEPEILLSYEAPTGRAFAGSLPVSEKETCSKNFNFLPIMAVQRKGAPCACGLLEIPLAENEYGRITQNTGGVYMFNENLSKVRKERGLTQEALANKLNVVRQTVSKWEKGTAVPDADTLCRIADALDVSIAALLGDSKYEEQQDTAAIAKALAQINEQLAVKNRHTATVWKVLCLISLIIAGILLGKAYWQTNREDSAIRLPDIIKASAVSFSCNGKELTCSFVPSIGNKDISYTVTLNCSDKSIPGATVTAQYNNGICTASFDRSKLFGDAGYSAVLSIDYCGDVRNVTLANGLCFDENICSWEQ